MKWELGLHAGYVRTVLLELPSSDNSASAATQQQVFTIQCMISLYVCVYIYIHTHTYIYAKVELSRDLLFLVEVRGLLRGEGIRLPHTTEVKPRAYHEATTGYKQAL